MVFAQDSQISIKQVKYICDHEYLPNLPCTGSKGFECDGFCIEAWHALITRIVLLISAPAAHNLLVSHIAFGRASYVQQKRQELKYRIDFAMQRLAKLGQLQ